MKINLQYAYTFLVIIGTVITASLIISQDNDLLMPSHIMPSNFTSPYLGQNTEESIGLITYPGTKWNNSSKLFESKKITLTNKKLPQTRQLSATPTPNSFTLNSKAHLSKTRIYSSIPNVDSKDFPNHSSILKKEALVETIDRKVKDLN